jgi:hypothetical protein
VTEKEPLLRRGPLFGGELANLHQPISPASPANVRWNRLSRQTTAFTRAGSTLYLRAAASNVLVLAVFPIRAATLERNNDDAECDDEKRATASGV